MKLDQENAALAAEFGIPSLTKKRQQKKFYVVQLRRATFLLQWICILNFLMLCAILYVFCTRKTEADYASSFSGKNSLLQAYSLNDAQAVTNQAAQNPTT